MKNLLYLLFATFVFVACSNDDDNSTVIDDLKNETFLDCFVGHKWVYDHPEIPRWEEWNVFDDGVMYLSNSQSFVYDFSNKDLKCCYVYDIKSGAFLINIDKLGTTEGIISDWDKYEFTWKTVDGNFTYGLLLNTYNMIANESLKPVYSTLITDAAIEGFTSHNTKIAEVNTNTGEITALSSGRTYIDVITTEGTAVIEVTVNSFMEYNYADFIGKSKNEVTNEFGFLYTTAGDDMIYNYRDGSEASESGLVRDDNWDYIIFRLDTKTGLVAAIELIAKDDVWFIPAQMTEYLAQLFYVYEEKTEENYKVFMNAETLEEAIVGVTWNTTTGALVIVQIPKEIETSVIDYGSFMDKPRDDVKSDMGGYSVMSDEESYITYLIENEYLRMAKFSFEANKEIKNTVQTVVLYLQPGHDEAFVKSEIENEYTFVDGVEGSYYNYNSNDGKIRVSYMPSSNLLQFILR